MHGVLYVCLPRSQARSSLQVRKKVCEYLTQEGFDTQLRVSGHCDYFSVGRRYSGRLNLLRLRQERPKEFARFWNRYWIKDIGDKEAERFFRQTFPKYRGELPINRGDAEFEGDSNDAQIMDKSLFQKLKGGSAMWWTTPTRSRSRTLSARRTRTTFEWPTTSEEAAKLWVVVIDYHF